MDANDLDFEGTANKGGAASGSNSNQGNQGGSQGTEHLDGKGGDNHGLEGKDNNQGGQQGGQQGSQGSDADSQQGGQNQGGDQGDSGFHDATQGNGGQQGNDSSSSTGELKAGDNLDIDGQTYTVDDKGNIVDAKGAIFKEAKDVADWLKSVNVDDGGKSDGDENKLSVAALQEALGTEVNDKDGKPVQYTDDADGIKAYVNDVIELRSNEIRQAAVNKVFADNPMLKQFSDYLIANNGSPIGFGQLPDRSKVQLDKDNAVQQEAIIRMAAAEFGNKSVNDNYINYLKQTGGLYDEARAQLANLVEKDKKTREDIARAAEARRQQEDKAQQDFWTNVSNVINGRVIGGYKLPESFVKEVNGTKLTLTPSDFYDYLTKPVNNDENGNPLTGYQRDLNALSDEDAFNREMLDAWLMFTGGTYKDLINLAVNEDKVRTLKIKSKQQRAARTIKINTKRNTKADINDIILQ